jgi:O-antigen ligase
MGDAVTIKLLSRIALLAAALLPIAHLTSLGVMEASGFVLLTASAVLFALESSVNSAVALRRVHTGAAIPIVGYVILTLLSIGVMLDQPDDQIAALRELKWVLYFFAFLYFFDRFWSDAWRRYIPVLSSAVAVMGLFGLCQFVYGWEWPRPESVLSPWGEYFRVTGFFNQPQSFAGNLGMATLFLLGFTMSHFERGSRVVENPPFHLLAFVVMGLLGVLLTLTRSAWLGAAVVAVLAFGRVKTSWGAITLVVFLVLTGIGWYSGSPFSDRLSSDVSVNEESIEIRQELWEANWRMFQDSPYLGIGPGQNLSRLEEYYQEAEVEYGIIDRAHNNILEHLAGQGLFVAGFYLIFSGYFLWAAYCVSVRQDADRFVRSIGAGSLCAQVYFHILGLVDSNFFDQEVKNIVVWDLGTDLLLRIAAREKPAAT